MVLVELYANLLERQFTPVVPQSGDMLQSTATSIYRILTPKIPCLFLPNSTVLDIVGKIDFSKN
jgi:hypothetical protein